MSRRGQEPEAGDKSKLKAESPSFRPSAPSGIGPGGPKKFSKGRFNPSRNFSVSPSVARDAPEPRESPSRKFNPAKTFSPGASGGAAAAAVAAATGNAASSQQLLANGAVPGALNKASLYQSLYHAPMHPLLYHLYAPAPFRQGVSSLERHERFPEDLFLSNQLRQELQERNDATLQVLSQSSLPEYIHVYHSLVPLDVKPGGKDRFGHETWLYKAISNTDGRTYCLLKVEDFQLKKDHALQIANKWKRVSSGSVVGVVEAFTTLAFGEKPALIIVYEYFPLSRPLAEVYKSSPPEGLMWSIAAQLVNAIKAIHHRQLAVRVLNTKTVLVTQKDRVRIGSCAVMDIVDYDDSYANNLKQRQEKDWRDLGNLLIDLSKPNTVAQKYSSDFATFVETLITGDHTDIPALIAPHIWSVFDGSLKHTDTLETDLMSELENGRLVRLLAKLEYVLDRPEYENDPQWAPTGAKYPLKLFRDFAFHQHDERDRPSLNLAHSIAALNRLDAGTDENVLLSSQDGSTRIIMSYKEIKSMFEHAFRDLSAASAVA